MLIFPAIDLLGGKVVRLLRGDYGAVTQYELRPSAAAEKFYAAGARCLHVVDLDGARQGRAVNADAVREALSAAPLLAEVGGGIRTEAQAEAYFEAGAARVILGTAAVRDPALVRRLAARFPGKVAVGVDARDGKVAVEGWEEKTDLDSFDFCRRIRDEGVEYVVYTDVARDGALAGANLGAYARLAAIEGLNVTASGGVSTESDIRALREMGLYAAIVGKALYEGKLTLAAALAAAEG